LNSKSNRDPFTADKMSQNSYTTNTKQPHNPKKIIVFTVKNFADVCVCVYVFLCVCVCVAMWVRMYSASTRTCVFVTERLCEHRSMCVCVALFY